MCVHIEACGPVHNTSRGGLLAFKPRVPSLPETVCRAGLPTSNHDVHIRVTAVPQMCDLVGMSLLRDHRQNNTVTFQTEPFALAVQLSSPLHYGVPGQAHMAEGHKNHSTKYEVSVGDRAKR